MIRHRLFRSAALGLTLAAFSAPAALASQDLRSPDSRDAAITSHSSQDLRSPDARDMTDGRGTFSAPEVTVVRMTEPAPRAHGGGLDWPDAAIGAAFGVALGLIALALTRVKPLKRSVTSRTA
jgi:hypothetical protein